VLSPWPWFAGTARLKIAISFSLPKEATSQDTDQNVHWMGVLLNFSLFGHC
jgi:hypothetical protein